jgi:N-acyl homoserine lactone hydrolase
MCNGFSRIYDRPPVSVRLHPINSGEIQLRVMAPRSPRRGPAKLPRTLLRSFLRSAHWYPVPVFLVEHPSEGPFLIDAGYDPSVATDPTRTLGFVFGKVVMKHRLADRTAAEQVAERGVAPADITQVVMTHLHNDHVSGAGQWPAATFVVDAVERRAARGPGPYVKPLLATIGRWREVDYAQAEPFEAFSKTIDLFGDGTVRLVSSPGHSPGHQSVLLRLRDRHALICGDAAMSTRELEEPVIDGIVMDQDAYLRSGEEAREFMRSHPDTLAIPSHDAALWPRLEQTYD